MLSRFRGALIYTAICLATILLFKERAWQHVATLNGDEWQPIQTFIREIREGDEPICFLPSWTSGHATDLYKFRNIGVLASPEQAWTDRESPLPGFFVVSQFGAFDESDVPRDLYPHRDHIQMGGADVYLFRQSAFTLPENLALRVREGRCVLHGPEKKRVEFPWNRTGFVFPLNSLGPDKSWTYLGCRMEQDRFGGRSQYGIWFHPPPPGYSLSLTWSEMELDSWLVVSGGIRDRVAKKRGPTVKMSAWVNGKKLATLRFPSKRGWKTFAMDTGIRSGGTATAKVSFKVWAKKNHSRHFIFNGHFENSRPEKALDPNEEREKRASRRSAEGNKQDESSPSEPIDLPIKGGEKRRGKKQPLRTKTPTGEPSSELQGEER